MANLRGGTLIGGSVAINYKNLLKCILTLDGPGSGIDADLLDGHHGDDYLLRSGGTMTGAIKWAGSSDGIDPNNTGIPLQIGCSQAQGCYYLTTYARLKILGDTDGSTNTDEFVQIASGEGMKPGSDKGLIVRKDKMTFYNSVDWLKSDLVNRMVLAGRVDPNSAGIVFGAQQDTNIYRGGANELTTDDVLNAVMGFKWDGQSLDERYFARRGQISANTQWNSIIEPGAYKVQMDTTSSSNNVPPSSCKYGVVLVLRTAVVSEDRVTQLYFPCISTDTSIYWRIKNNNEWTSWNTIDSRNYSDGRYVKKAGDTMTGNLTFEDTANGPIIFHNTTMSGGWARGICVTNNAGNRIAAIGINCTNNLPTKAYMGINAEPWNGVNSLTVDNNNAYYNNHKIWHAGNDGTGSGLDADLLDGHNSDDFVKKAGDTMRGNLNMHDSQIIFDTTLKGLYWYMNSDYAKVYFKNDSDGDSDSYLCMETGDNMNEYFKFRHIYDNKPKDLLDIKYDRIQGHVPIYQAAFNDYAEYFEKGEEDIEPGDIVMLDPKSDKEQYVKATEKYSKLVVGICSDEFAHCIGGNGDDSDNDNFIPVGLAGRLKVKLIGKAKKGDFIIASHIPGVAKVSQEYIPGAIIGKCLENKDTYQIERVRIVIQNM